MLYCVVIALAAANANNINKIRDPDDPISGITCVSRSPDNLGQVRTMFVGAIDLKSRHFTHRQARFWAIGPARTLATAFTMTSAHGDSREMFTTLQCV